MRGNSGGGLDWIDQTQFCCSVRVSPCSAADGFASGVVAQHLAGRRAAGNGAAGHSGRLGLSTTSPRVVVLTPACRFGDEGVAERAAPGTLATWTPVEPDASLPVQKQLVMLESALLLWGWALGTSTRRLGSSMDPRLLGFQDVVWMRLAGQSCRQLGQARPSLTNRSPQGRFDGGRPSRAGSRDERETTELPHGALTGPVAGTQGKTHRRARGHDVWEAGRWPPGVSEWMMGSEDLAKIAAPSNVQRLAAKLAYGMIAGRDILSRKARGRPACRTGTCLSYLRRASKSPYIRHSPCPLPSHPASLLGLFPLRLRLLLFAVPCPPPPVRLSSTPQRHHRRRIATHTANGARTRTHARSLARKGASSNPLPGAFAAPRRRSRERSQDQANCEDYWPPWREAGCEIDDGQPVGPAATELHHTTPHRTTLVALDPIPVRLPACLPPSVVAWCQIPSIQNRRSDACLGLLPDTEHGAPNPVLILADAQDGHGLAGRGPETQRHYPEPTPAAHRHL
ncbi:hypothetical protein VFPBJ_01064 [Purpureocillium lilacinum]|uniref:Uncharacterized protein n=1 Tax=Purpureocillium lilacinum TaxID=33203 RepID=A0A179HA45_PURLI|nr:hypothetical protein VFPBJ_01064 [Purpureocillium lilacinum]